MCRDHLFEEFVLKRLNLTSFIHSLSSAFGKKGMLQFSNGRFITSKCSALSEH